MVQVYHYGKCVSGCGLYTVCKDEVSMFDCGRCVYCLTVDTRKCGLYCEGDVQFWEMCLVTWFYFKKCVLAIKKEET